MPSCWRSIQRRQRGVADSFRRGRDIIEPLYSIASIADHSVAAVRLTTPGGWRALEEELDAWRYSGRKAVMWWRDDDAVQQPASIDHHLFAMGSHFAIPIARAVIPAKVDRSLASVVQGRDVTIFQHAWDHTNRALPAAYKAELAVGRAGVRRAAEEVREQIWNGWSRHVRRYCCSAATALRLRGYHLVPLSRPIGILTHHLDHNDAAVFAGFTFDSVAKA
jgi:hypothetical protein